MSDGIEKKDMAVDLSAAAETGVIEGYASLFNAVDHGGDMVAPGAYGESLALLAAEKRKVKMLWQHDPQAPIGVWDEVREDERGLHVKGRILEKVSRGREALELIAAGALDGLSIGYRTLKARKDAEGRRVLLKVELWEVSLVTFPMLPSATLSTPKGVSEDVIEKLRAGDRLTEREFEMMVKGLGLSNSQAERAARIHLKGQGEPAVEADEEAAFWAAMRG